jgi:hypothetical protein
MNLNFYQYLNEHETAFVDACHACYTARLALRERFPETLGPDQVYEIINPGDLLMKTHIAFDLPTATNRADGNTLNSRRRWKIILFLVVIMFSIMACVPSCSYLLPYWHIEGPANTLDIYGEFEYTGVFTPTQGTYMDMLELLKSPTHPQELYPTFLDDLAINGYLAIRVPHAPPTYTTSTLLSGIPGDLVPEALTVNYFSPPSAATPTQVNIPLVRRTEYETIVNALYPITDGKSHWEVWWLPEGETFPVPTQPFAFKTSTQYGEQAFLVRFRLDFVDANPLACAGCELTYLAYNGYTFMEPFAVPIVLDDGAGQPAAGSPSFGFNEHCQQDFTPIQYLSPGAPYSQIHWLENYITQPQSFDITTNSSQGWVYDYFLVDTNQQVTPVQYPFEVQVDAAAGLYEPGCIGIMAVYTPTLTTSDTFRETFLVTAALTTDPAEQASAFGFALAPGYELNEGGGPNNKIYLPIVLK